jgi:hypothetical protein
MHTKYKLKLKTLFFFQIKIQDQSQARTQHTNPGASFTKLTCTFDISDPRC